MALPNAGRPRRFFVACFVLARHGNHDSFGASVDQDEGSCREDGSIAGEGCGAHTDLELGLSCTAAAEPSDCGSGKVCFDLLPGKRLVPGEWLSSRNGEHVVALSGGQLQLRRADSAPEPLWAMPPNASGGLDVSAVCVVGGHLLLESSAGNAIWISPAPMLKEDHSSEKDVKSIKLTVSDAGDLSLRTWRNARAWSSDSAGVASRARQQARKLEAEAASAAKVRTPPRESGPSCTAAVEPSGCGSGKSCIELLPGKRLVPGEWLSSRNGEHVVALSGGQLQLRQASSALEPLWAMPPNSPGGLDVSAVCVVDGHLLLESSTGSTIWISPAPTLKEDHSSEKDVKSIKLTVSDAGDLSLRTWRNAAAWSSHSSGSSSQQRQRAKKEEPEDADAAKARKMDHCVGHLSCEPCLADDEEQCGWCIARRRCVPDMPWMCQSETDHVSRPGPKGVGKRKACPTLQEVEEGHRQRRERANAAALPPGDDFEDSTGRAGADGRVGVGNSGGRSEDHAAASTADEGASGTASGDEDLADEALRKELRRRVRFAEEELGSQPYQVLNVKKDTSTSEIRKSYRRLSMQFHPDKWAQRSEALQQQAETAFADITRAYETIGAPDKRAAFDDYSGDDFGGHWKDKAEDKWRGDEDLYFGDPLIATLTEDLWERRLAGQTVWVIKFYTAWCPHCRNTRQGFRELAKSLENQTVEVGAVNCVKQTRICAEYVGVSSFPTILLLNREYGMMQSWKKGIEAHAMAKWVEDVSREWSWLFRHASVHWTLNASSFNRGGIVAESDSMWVVVFLDGRECPPCKAACSNLQRLSASLRGLPVEVGIVDCSLPDMKDFCYSDHAIPTPPHRPVTKAWRSGAKNITDAPEPGELLYSPADLEPHAAFMIVEKLVRLALADRVDGSALTEAGGGDFEGEEEKEESSGDEPGNTRPHQTGPRPKMLWDGDPVKQLDQKGKPWVSWTGFSSSQLGQ